MLAWSNIPGPMLAYASTCYYMLAACACICYPIWLPAGPRQAQQATK